ncbi:hypothetical protein Droror1_Dr00003070 [Drosera rotundifolia]
MPFLLAAGVEAVTVRVLDFGRLDQRMHIRFEGFEISYIAIKGNWITYMDILKLKKRTGAMNLENWKVRRPPPILLTHALSSLSSSPRDSSTNPPCSPHLFLFGDSNSDTENLIAGLSFPISQHLLRRMESSTEQQRGLSDEFLI